MDGGGTNNRSKRVTSEDGREAIEVRITTVEPARGKDPDAAITVTSAVASSSGSAGVSAASCSSSSSSRAATGTASDKRTFAKASTPRLRSVVH